MLWQPRLRQSLSPNLGRRESGGGAPSRRPGCPAVYTGALPCIATQSAWSGVSADGSGWWWAKGGTLFARPLGYKRGFVCEKATRCGVPLLATLEPHLRFLAIAMCRSCPKHAPQRQRKSHSRNDADSTERERSGGGVEIDQNTPLPVHDILLRKRHRNLTTSDAIGSDRVVDGRWGVGSTLRRPTRSSNVMALRFTLTRSGTTTT